MIQNNYGRKYESIMMVLKIMLSIRASIIMLQELFIGNCELYYSAFNVY